uniref:Serpentine receptor class gamma n=1 Tax=Strongyloides papillosus TaxID=174720 RepID=A0A0N5CIU8_STREA
MFLSGITITFNRYFAIKFPTRYRIFWSGWKVFLLIIWPLFITLPIFFKYISAEGIYIEDNIGRLSVTFVNLNVSNDIWMTSTYIHCISLLINLILTVMLILTARKKSRNSKGQNNSMKIDIMLTKYAFMYFIMFGLLVSIEIPMLIATNLGAYDLANNMFTLIALCQ